MASTKDEITAIAVEHGYTGRKPDSIAKAIDALADTLAGEDVTGSRSISGAIHALAPYIGTGGGGGSLRHNGYNIYNVSTQIAALDTRPDDLSSTPPNIMFTPRGVSYPSILPAGFYVCILNDGANSIRVLANSDRTREIETETREVAGNTLCCFVMPEEDVVIEE